MKKHYHFIGVGGIGMGALASLLLDKGLKVSGSDVKENAMTTTLRSRGAKIFIGHDAVNIEGANIVVYSSAIKQNNPELSAALLRKLPVIQRARLLADLMEEHIGITIAGAHGKTTTSSMVSKLLVKAGLHPTTAVGGIINETGSNARLGGGKFFVAETDESDGSFLYFTPQYSIITNIDFEHIDHYHSWENILDAFVAFVDRTKPDGKLIVCGEDKNLLEILLGSNKDYWTYGWSDDFDLSASNVAMTAFGSSFHVSFKGKYIGTIDLNVPGKHNILNAMACLGLGLSLGIDFNIIKESLKEYKGVQRRFQQKGLVNDILVIDDYAHHPTELQATLAAARNIGRRVVAAFQPHRYTRLKFLQKEFANSLMNTNILLVTDIYAASESPIDGVTSERLVADIKKLGHNHVSYCPKDQILNTLLEIVKPGDIVLTLGAGDITKISDDLVRMLSEKVGIK